MWGVFRSSFQGLNNLPGRAKYRSIQYHRGSAYYGWKHRKVMMVQRAFF